jgi:DNA-directed RNA polymerase subunit E'/Rpb7
MFVLAEIEDTVKIVPNDFGKNDNDAITDALNEKFANKVLKHAHAQTIDQSDIICFICRLSKKSDYVFAYMIFCLHLKDLFYTVMDAVM